MTLLIERKELSVRCRYSLAMAGYLTIESLLVENATLLAVRNFSYNCLWELWYSGLLLDLPE